MSLSINNVRGVLSSVSFDNETSSKKLAAVDTFEMVRGGSFLKSRKTAGASGAKCGSSDNCKEAAVSQTQNQAQDAKVVEVKESPAQGQSQISQVQGKEADAKAASKY